MGVPQFGRKVSILVGQDGGAALELSDLRVVYTIKRGDNQTPNSARLRVFNVSDNTRQRIEGEFKRIVVQAGYAGNFGVIFDGTIKQVRRGRENQTETYLDITAADGDLAYNHAVVNETLGAGSRVSDHIRVCTSEMEKYGVTMGYVPWGKSEPTPAKAAEERPLPRGKVMFGMARDFLRSAAKTTQTVWSIQDGKLIMVPETSYLPDEIPVITAETGMIGSPEQTQNGITIRMLTNPSIKIARLIRIDNASVKRYENSLTVKKPGQDKQNEKAEKAEKAEEPAKLQDDGFYYVMSVEHAGDTRGKDYYTDVICLAADATVPPENAIKKFSRRA